MRRAVALCVALAALAGAAGAAAWAQDDPVAAGRERLGTARRAAVEAAAR